MAAPAAQSGAPTQIENKTIDEWLLDVPPGNFTENAEEVCKSVLREINSHPFMNTTPYDANIDEDYNTESGFGEHLNKAKKLIEKCVNILKKINTKTTPDTTFDEADNQLIEYIATTFGIPGSNAQKKTQKKLVADTVVNLFKNQMYLLAFLICKSAHEKALDVAKIHGEEKVKEIGTSTNFIERILNKLTVVNKLNGEFYKNLMPSSTSNAQAGGGLSQHNTLLSKCLYKAYKHQYMLSKLRNKM
jgi:hypothetical protein